MADYNAAGFRQYKEQLCGIDRVDLFVRLFGDLLATATLGQGRPTGQYEFNSLIYNGLTERVDR